MSYIAPSLVIAPAESPGQLVTVNGLSGSQVELVISDLNRQPAGGVERATLTPQETNALITALITAAQAVSVALSGTVSTTLDSTTITFSANQTLPAGTMLVFGNQAGVVYFLASAINNTTGGTLTTPFGGTTNASNTASAY